MSFLWPMMLWSLLLLPLLVLLYLWLLGRRKKVVLPYSHLALVREAAGKAVGWRRHLPPALLLLAIGAMLVATARPTAMVALPMAEQTIILAMDVSGSMRATDVEPNRLVAMQEAGKAFLDQLPRNVRVGVVSFAGSAAVVQPPTFSREDVRAAIDRFQLQRATAIGSGLLLSLATLFPDAGIDVSQITGQRPMPPPLGAAPPPPPRAFTPVEPGSYAFGAIILLTDGQRTAGPDPIETAMMAAERGVRVYTVGIGTREGDTIAFEGWTMRVRLDEDTLKEIAQITRAEYFYAGTAADLRKVYEGLSTRVVMERRETEISGLFAALGALLTLLAAGLSLVWFNRLL
jgi:Ca-activated chloride channel family protein